MRLGNSNARTHIITLERARSPLAKTDPSQRPPAFDFKQHVQLGYFPLLFCVGCKTLSRFFELFGSDLRGFWFPRLLPLDGFSSPPVLLRHTHTHNPYTTHSSRATTPPASCSSHSHCHTQSHTRDPSSPHHSITHKSNATNPPPRHTVSHSPPNSASLHSGTDNPRTVNADTCIRKSRLQSISRRSSLHLDPKRAKHANSHHPHCLPPSCSTLKSPRQSPTPGQ